MGTHLRVLSESFSMNTNMTGFRYFLDKVASALQVLKGQKNPKSITHLGC